MITEEQFEQIKRKAFAKTSQGYLWVEDDKVHMYNVQYGNLDVMAGSGDAEAIEELLQIIYQEEVEEASDYYSQKALSSYERWKVSVRINT